MPIKTYKLWTQYWKQLQNTHAYTKTYKLWTQNRNKLFLSNDLQNSLCFVRYANQIVIYAW